MANPYDVEFCQECHRPKARNAIEASWGFCDKSRAFRDPEASSDCAAFTEARLKRVAHNAEIESLRAHLKEKGEALQELQTKLAEAERDAERYRWLRYGDNDELVLSHAKQGYWFILRNEKLDDVIDAAIAKGEE